jgi:hypothetical protein
VILMISSEGYEGRVMELVQGKQNLFDNVIDPEASEDVVGVSPKLLEKLVADLAETREGAAAPAALVDPLTLKSLQRLGEASPVQEKELYYTAESDGRSSESLLLKQAKEHFTAAELLVEQDRNGPALELLNTALLATAAARGGQSRAPTAAQAGVWLFSEALPQGWLDEAQAALIMRGVSLASRPNCRMACWLRCWRTVGVLCMQQDEVLQRRHV